MKLRPLHIVILSIQSIAMLLNLYSIFIKKVQDYNGHIIAFLLVAFIMVLSLKSWSLSEQNKNKV